MEAGADEGGIDKFSGRERERETNQTFSSTEVVKQLNSHGVVINANEARLCCVCGCVRERESVSYM